ncbi:complex I NDUFA9 subunit family protein [Ancylobacter dichloromethanicus]|uniref:3-beta-hydroxy-Delta(5)-steroid dehydrogenase n=1 Tax=Ancylobacter dichloromethanicus TaxID=518825 RepID=A0A9W6N0X6_9HYPH|nr:complex I NDUFA9 subunit family protein [Ancylobacter dichloromethanicus]MBS7556689.1 complex I NDUFA9 subunit family protein [Ancylobacter dichloromethanicus]GLK73540.1 3-beta-hydroxy-Delta(5)-steroid dehydrogenase [Ancylobacter dichloromethanicus]
MVDITNELPLESEAELVQRPAPMERLVTIYGGSGFVGRHVVRALTRLGWRVRVAVRRPDLIGHLQPLGAVGQIIPVQANLRYPASVLRAAEGAEVLINLVGVLHESGRQSFEAVHAFGARQVAQAAREVGARLIHGSAIGAAADSSSFYARSKAAGEAAALELVPGAVVMRPSIMFGPEDDFFNRFAAMARLSPALPLIGGGLTRFQPAFVGDVASAFAKAVDGLARPGTIYELGGPEVLTFKQLMEILLAEIDRKRLLVPMPAGLASFNARFLELLPNPLLTRDQVRLLAYDNVVSAAAKAEGRTLEGLGIAPTALGAILPGYLWRYRKAGQFSRPEAA